MTPVCVAGLASVGRAHRARRVTHRAGGGDDLSQPEVEHLHDAARRQLDVGRLQIPMNDPLLVRRLERFGDLFGDRERFLERHRSIRDAFRERGSVDELHDESGRVALGGSRWIEVLYAVDLGDVPMVERREQLRLTFEPGQPVRITGEPVGEDLDGDVAIELRVARAIHLAHAPGAEQGLHLVRAQTGAWCERHRSGPFGSCVSG